MSLIPASTQRVSKDEGHFSLSRRRHSLDRIPSE
jgi:hypothetical protein